VGLEPTGTETTTQRRTYVCLPTHVESGFGLTTFTLTSWNGQAGDSLAVPLGLEPSSFCINSAASSPGRLRYKVTSSCAFSQQLHACVVHGLTQPCPRFRRCMVTSTSSSCS